MTQAYKYQDDELTNAASEFHDVILNLRNDGMSDEKIIIALTGELHGLTEELKNKLEYDKW